MKKLLIVSLVCLLSACSSTQPIKQTTVLEKYKYVTTTVPEEFYKFPDRPLTIDPKKSTNKDISLWIVDSERYGEALENKLRSIKDYLENVSKTNLVNPSDILDK